MKRNNKKIGLNILMLLILLGGIIISISTINGGYIKASATAIDLSGSSYTQITYTNLSTSLNVGDRVYFANTAGTKTGIGSTDSQFGYKTTVQEELVPAIVTDIDDYDIAFRFFNDCYIDTSKTMEAIKLTSINKTYLTINENNNLTVNEGSKVLGLSGGTIGLHSSTITASLRMLCYKINDFHATIDEYSNEILNKLSCDNGLTPPNKDKWLEIKNFYYDYLSNNDKETLSTIDGNESGNNTEQAIAKYDYIIKKYNKTGNYLDYLNRANVKFIPDNISITYLNNDNNSNNYLIIISIAVLVLLTTTGIIYFRKRR